LIIAEPVCFRPLADLRVTKKRTSPIPQTRRSCIAQHFCYHQGLQRGQTAVDIVVINGSFGGLGYRPAVEKPWLQFAARQALLWELNGHHRIVNPMMALEYHLGVK